MDRPTKVTCGLTPCANSLNLKREKEVMARKKSRIFYGLTWRGESYQRRNMGRTNAWLKLATEEHKPSVLRPFH